MGCRPHLGLSTAACRVRIRRFYGGARIDTYEGGEQADRMDRTDTHLDDAGPALFTDSLALLSAARRLELNAGARAAAGVLPLALALVEETLYALDDCCAHAGDALIPPGDPRESVEARFARAAADWPGVTDGAQPSRELQARILVAFDDTRTALRAAGHRCGAARDLVATSIPVAERAPGDRRQLSRFT
jgi:hypothetical protein